LVKSSVISALGYMHYCTSTERLLTGNLPSDLTGLT